MQEKEGLLGTVKGAKDIAQRIRIQYSKKGIHTKDTGVS